MTSALQMSQKSNRFRGPFYRKSKWASVSQNIQDRLLLFTRQNCPNVFKSPRLGLLGPALQGLQERVVTGIRIKCRWKKCHRIRSWADSWER